MTAFTPTTREFTPPHAPDWLASATMTALLRSSRRRRFWSGPARTFAMGLPTLGVLPALLLPRDFVHWSLAERLQVREWLNWLSRERQARGESSLDIDSSAPRAVPWLAYGGCATALGGACLFAGKVLSGASAGTLYIEALGNLWRTPRPAFTIVWMTLITTGYALLLIATIIQTASTRELLRRVDAAAGTILSSRVVAAPRRGTIVWLLAGVAGAALGAWWTIPMLIAAAAQADYVGRVSAAMRAALAESMRREIASRPPHDRQRVLVPQQVWPTCANVRCEALVPPTELRCPRCGAAVSEIGAAE